MDNSKSGCLLRVKWFVLPGSCNFRLRVPFLLFTCCFYICCHPIRIFFPRFILWNMDFILKMFKCLLLLMIHFFSSWTLWLPNNFHLESATLCSVHWGNNPPQKQHPLFSTKPTLNLQTIQAPLFRHSPLYIGFSNFSVKPP